MGLLALVTKEQPDFEPDAALLARFARLRDERAFAELMARHGPLVMGACLRMLAQRQDAEDAFQAVFVTLSAKARALRRVRSLSGWLHNVAVRVSLNLIKMNRRREQRLGKAHDNQAKQRNGREFELREMLDEELTALPARYREAVVLCDLQGYTRDEAARKLAIPAGTVATWVARGRRLLRDRLVRRGVTIGVGGITGALSRLTEAAPQVTAELVEQTVRHAELFLAGESAVPLPAAAKISSLAQGVIHTMFLTKLSTTVCIVALATALVLGASPLSMLVGGRSDARAQVFTGFLEEFDDGSATDGNPVKWVPFDVYSNGTYRVEQQSFVLEPNAVTTPLVSLVDGVLTTDVSIRTQVRVTSGNSQGTALFARFVPGANQHTYQGGIESTGDVYIGWNDADTRFHSLANLLTDLRPNQEDVVLQFDLFGNSLKLFAWRPTEPMPTEPTLTVIDNQFPGPGTVGLLHHPTGLGAGAFRFVHASPTPIPEPSTAALGSLGMIALAGFVFRIRLNRVRSAQ